MFKKIREENVEGFVFLPPHHPKRIFPLSRDTITVQSRANADLKRAITDDIQCIFLTIEIIQQKLGNVKMPFLSWINACFRLSKMSHAWMMPWLEWLARLAFMLRVYCVFFKWQVAVFYGWINDECSEERQSGWRYENINRYHKYFEPKHSSYIPFIQAWAKLNSNRKL